MSVLLKSLYRTSCRTPKIPFISSINRHPSVRSCSHEDMASTVKILNRDIDSGLLIDSYSTVGFKLNSGFSIMGPLVMFGKTVLAWNIQNVEELNKREAFCLFDVLEPQVDLLFIGVGDYENVKKMMHLLQLGKELNINIEVASTEHAIASFNFLTSERRNVAVALLPPTKIKITENEAVSERIDQEFELM